MKNEIKEILEDVERHLDYVEATKQTSIRDNEMKVMYDYITNLEQENEKLKKLKERNQLEREVYKIRIDKAIEYINHENFKRNILVGVSTKKYTRDILNNVLNILKGGKDE